MGDIEGIGMGVPGPVKDDGTVLRCVNLGWGVFNVAQSLSVLCGGIKVKAGNDANVAALGEMWQGGGKGHQDVVMITLGTGVGGGIIREGRIVAGVNGAGGEIGHMPMVDDESECCGCGKKGCLEQYASANGLVRVAERYIAAHRDVATKLDLNAGFTAKDVCDAAKAGDAAGIAAVEQSMKLLGKAMAAVACVMDLRYLLSAEASQRQAASSSIQQQSTIKSMLSMQAARQRSSSPHSATQPACMAE